jgi:hypothetical protein
MPEKWTPVTLTVSFPDDIPEYAQELESYYNTKELLFYRPSGAALRARTKAVTRS